MFLGRTVETQFTETSRLVSLFPSGVGPRLPSRDFGRGNAQRASANDPPIAQRIAALRVARVVDNQFQKTRKHGRRFGWFNHRSISGVMPARWRHGRLSLPVARNVGPAPCDRLK